MATNDDDEDLAKVLEINELELDRCWVEQPLLFFRFARELQQVQSEVRQMEDELELIQADVSRRIRDDPAKYGLTKVTEPAVKAAIPEHPKMVKQRKRINSAKHKVGLLTAVVNALEHRKRALEKLVDLHGQNYFSTPRADETSKEAALGSIRRNRVKKKIRRRHDDDE